MKEHEPVRVTLKDGSPWEKELHPKETALLLIHLLGHDIEGICNYVVPVLGLDVPTRRRRDFLADVSERSVHQYRIINKAMSMELLSASLMAGLNRPKEVRALCGQKNGLPYFFSLDGADVTARYVNDENDEPFRVILEVTARKFVGKTVMRTQLNQGYEHAKVEAEDPDSGPVYALVIGGGKIGSNPTIWKAYRDYVKEKGVGRHERVRLLPLYAGDFVGAVRRIAETMPAGTLQFRSGLLVKIFDALIDDISGEFMPGDPDSDWMCDKFVDMVIADADEADGRLGNSKEEPLVFVRLNGEQIVRAREANEKPKGITHALVCGRYGRMFGTEKQCQKHYKLWRGEFAPRFSGSFRTSSYSIKDFESTSDLRMRLVNA